MSAGNAMDANAQLARLRATLAVVRDHEQLVRVPQGICVEVVEVGHEGCDPSEMIDVGARFVLKRHSPGQETLSVLRVTGGRDADHAISLHHPSISENHFELNVSASGVALRDLGSTNGTWIGRARLADGRAFLTAGATFAAGSVRLRLTSVDETQVAISGRARLESLDGQSQVMRELFALLERLAPTPIDVLVEGENGTGKGQVARALHQLSGRRGRFVVLDCATLSPNLAVSKILGHKEGAFTGAVRDEPGCFEMANGGTLFLDEIGVLPAELQPRLLGVLQDREVVRLGEQMPRKVDVRIVAATSADLSAMVKQGDFREDLFYRLAGIRVLVPPLRDRIEDVPLLARRFLAQDAEQLGRRIELGADAIEALSALRWSGNVRQLEQLIRRAAFLTTGDELTAEDLKRYGNEWGEIVRRLDASDLFSLPLRQARDSFDHRYCEAILRQCEGDLEAAADFMGYSARGLRSLLTKLGLRGG